MIDFEALNQRLDPVALLPVWLPDGEARGKNYFARNPTRDDHDRNSFAICIRGSKAGTWKDFATGDSGTDLVSLWAYLHHGNDQAAAARDLQARHGDAPLIVTKKPTASELETFVPVVPASAPKPDFRHHELGEPTTFFDYRDTTGERMFFVCRWDATGDRGKEIRPLTLWQRPDGSLRWRWKHPPEDLPRPLYGAEMLARRPESRVILVEGEGKAQALQAMLSDHVVVTWLGGASRAGDVDLEPLRGRYVTLVPDEDAQRVRLTAAESKAGVDPESKPMLPLAAQPSMRAMIAIRKRLVGVAKATSLVEYQVGQRISGWDLGDAIREGWTREQILSHVHPPEKPSYLPWNTALVRYEFPMLSDKGAIANTLPNFEHMLNAYGVSVRYNKMRKEVDIEIPGVDLGEDDRMNCAMAEIGSVCALNSMPRESRLEYVKRMAHSRAYHPIADWIESKPWDGKDRVLELCKTVQTTGAMDDTFKSLLIIRWMISAVAAIYSSNFAAHGVLVFTGAGGTGKTSWFKSLVPHEMQAILSGASIDPQDRDSKSIALSHWIVELGELDGTFRKADIARLKAFITASEDKFRRPYSMENSDYRRRTVFCGSVNEHNYLVDETGNRRWWTIPVTRCDFQHGLDMQQVWAQILGQYKANSQWWLTDEESALLSAHNTAFEQADPIEEALRVKFDFDYLVRSNFLTTTQVLAQIGIDRPTKAQLNQAASLLRKILGTEPHFDRRARVFAMPPVRGS